jgi:hypothetical protein
MSASSPSSALTLTLSRARESGPGIGAASFLYRQGEKVRMGGRPSLRRAPPHAARGCFRISLRWRSIPASVIS